MIKLSLVVLVGGKGTRLKKISKGIPKPLIKINNKTFLDNILNHYSKYNFNKIYLMSGYKNELFNKYDNKIINSIKIKLFKEKKPLGTAGSLFLLKKKIKNDFILINGDTYFDFDLKKFLNKINKKHMAHIALKKNTNYFSNKKLSNLTLDKNKSIIHSDNSKLMNGGAIFFKQKILEMVDSKYSSLEENLLPKLIKKKLVGGSIYKNFFIDIGIPKNFYFAEKNLKKILYKKAIFLDRDGVVNYDYGYVHKFEKFKFRPGVIKALKYLRKNNYYIFIVTNQAGIGKGKFTLNQYINLNFKIKEFLSKKNIFLDAVEFCPHHQNAKILKYKKKSNFRKPGNLMIEKILKRWFIKRKHSIMIGDKKTDFLAAKKSKISFFYVENNLYNQLRKII